MNFKKGNREKILPLFKKGKQFIRHLFKKNKIVVDDSYATAANKNALLSSPLFIPYYYSKKNSIANPNNIDNLAYHYLCTGWKEGLDTSPDFSGEAYIAMYPDTKHMPPLLHYLNFGRNEGRIYMSVEQFNSTFINDSDRLFVETNKKQNKKNILIISHEMSNTGAPRACMQMAVELQSKGMGVTTWSLKPGSLTAEYKELGLYYKICTGIFRNNELDESDADFIKNSFDLILLNTICTIPLAYQLRPYASIITCWIHDGKIGFQSFQAASEFERLEQNIDKIFVVGDYTKRVAEHYFPKSKMTNLLYGIDDVAKMYDQTNDYQSVENCTHYLLAGSVEKRKGQDLVVDSLKQLPEYVLKQVKIHIVGSNCDSSIYQKLIQDTTGCLILHGTLPHNDLLQLMKKIDILLCPSLDDPMPIVATEAMMLSKPVIVSNETGTSYILQWEQEAGFVIKANDANEIASIILKTYNKKETFPIIGKHARLIYEKYFTSKVFSENIHREICSLLQ